MEIREIKKEWVEDLFCEYGVKECKGVENSICEYINGFARSLENDNPNRKLELAEMLYYIKGISDEIDIKGTITEPKKDEIKNTERKAHLNISTIKNDMEMMLTETLRKEFGMGAYLETHYNEKGCADDNFYNKIEEGYFESEDFLKLPYENEELEQIIKYCKKDEEINKTFTDNRKIGLICNKILCVLRQNNALEDNCTIIKKYSLIYDIIALTGCVKKISTDKPYKGKMAKEKYDCVKNKINSFKSNLGAFKDLDMWVVEITD